MRLFQAPSRTKEAAYLNDDFRPEYSFEGSREMGLNRK